MSVSTIIQHGDRKPLRRQLATIGHPPSWVEVLPVGSDALATATDDLDPGERSAIALAEMLHTDLLLIDEAAGRAEVKRGACG